MSTGLARGSLGFLACAIDDAMSRVRLPGFALLLLLSACGATRSACQEKIQVRHAAEFGCSAPDVGVETLEWSGNYLKGTFVARGCGRRAVYVCNNGTCIRNGDAQQAATSGGASF